jgi:nitroreductase
MALLDLIQHRKSVREFLDIPVEREKIMTCLEAARLAPSESNSQPWRFIIVDDKELKDKLCDAAFGGIY